MAVSINWVTIPSKCCQIPVGFLQGRFTLDRIVDLEPREGEPTQTNKIDYMRDHWELVRDYATLSGCPGSCCVGWL